jgi:uncharacterized protein (DUF58 family)
VSGLHRSPFHGYSAEFSQYRHYRPGDDLKYVDWKLFGRTDRLYTKQFRETTNLHALIVVDCSASMAFADGAGVAKLQYAVLVAAAMAHLLARQGDAVGIAAFDATIHTFMPPRTGQNHLRAVLRGLARLKPSGSTAAGSVLRKTADLLRRRGALLVMSDLYDDEEETAAALRRAARFGHDVSVFHLVHRSEIDLAFGDPAEFVDLESGRRVLLDPHEARTAYRAAFAAFLDRWRSRCAADGVEYVRVLTHEPLEHALRQYLLRRSAGGDREMPRTRRQ